MGPLYEVRQDWPGETFVYARADSMGASFDEPASKAQAMNKKLDDAIRRVMGKPPRQGPAVRMPKFADMHAMPEDERIAMIGRQAQTKLVGVAIETNQPDKIARYIQKVTTQFPAVRHVDTTPGLTSGTSLVRFAPKRSN